MLYKVTLDVKKDWMEHPIDLKWAVSSDDPQDAIQQVLDGNDLSGVEIVNMSAEPQDQPIKL